MLIFQNDFTISMKNNPGSFIFIISSNNDNLQLCILHAILFQR